MSMPMGIRRGIPYPHAVSGASREFRTEIQCAIRSAKDRNQPRLALGATPLGLNPVHRSTSNSRFTCSNFGLRPLGGGSRNHLFIRRTHTTGTANGCGLKRMRRQQRSAMARRRCPDVAFVLSFVVFSFSSRDSFLQIIFCALELLAILKIQKSKKIAPHRPRHSETATHEKKL
jgi:hypothetical protein